MRSATRAFGRWLDERFLRGPFHGAGGRRYARHERPAFERFDERLLAQVADRLATARCVVDVGGGGGELAALAATRAPQATVVLVEPSAELVALAARRGRAPRPVRVVRASAEALPLADACADLAVCESSLRHFGDRDRALAELRRVLAPGGTLLVAELDPLASATRIDHHARAMSGWLWRAAFGPLVVRTAPPKEALVAAARRAGFELRRWCDDPWQPLYILDLG